MRSRALSLAIAVGCLVSGRAEARVPTRLVVVAEDTPELRALDPAGRLAPILGSALAALTAGDELALIGYGDTPRLLAPLHAADEAGRKAFAEGVERLDGRGRSARLGDALRLGARMLLEAPSDGHRGRLLVLSARGESDGAERTRTLDLVALQLRTQGAPVYAAMLGPGVDLPLLTQVAGASGGSVRPVPELDRLPRALLELLAMAVELDAVPLDGRGRFSVDATLHVASVGLTPEVGPAALISPSGQRHLSSRSSGVVRGFPRLRLVSPVFGEWRVEQPLDARAPTVLVEESSLDLALSLNSPFPTVDERPRLRVDTRYLPRGERRAGLPRKVSGYVTVRSPAGRLRDVPFAATARGVLGVELPVDEPGLHELLVFVRADDAERTRSMPFWVEPSCVIVSPPALRGGKDLAVRSSTACSGSLVSASLIGAEVAPEAHPRDHADPHAPAGHEKDTGTPLVRDAEGPWSRVTAPEGARREDAFQVSITLRRGGARLTVTRGPFHFFGGGDTRAPSTEPREHGEPDVDGRAREAHAESDAPAGHGADPAAHEAPSAPRPAHEGHEPAAHAEDPRAAEAEHPARAEHEPPPEHGEAAAHDAPGEHAQDRPAAAHDAPGEHHPTEAARHEEPDATMAAAHASATATTSLIERWLPASVRLTPEPTWPRGLLERLAVMNTPLAVVALGWFVRGRRRRR